MDKQTFLAALRQRLAGLPQDDIEQSLAFYSEMIDDRVEDGLSETEAVAAVGPIDEIADQILTQIPLTKLVKTRLKPRRALRGWEIALLVLGFPAWFPLLITAVVLVFTLFAVLWVLVAVCWAVDLSLLCGGVGGLVSILWLGFNSGGWFTAGCGLVCIGLGILFFFFCKWATKAIARCCFRLLRGIKSRFVKKEVSQ